MDLAGVRAAFEQNFTERGELGASIAVWCHGEAVVDLAAGFQDRDKKIPWTRKTPVLIWSATKALSSACLLHACSTHKIDLDELVERCWPEYASQGKEPTTMLHILSHQAGVPALRDSAISILDRESVVDALARQKPFWPPGQAHGYHTRTFGFLIDELLRRISGGIGVGSYFRQIFGEPLGLDLWIGVPSDLAEKVAPIQGARHNRTNRDEAPFYVAYNEAQSLTHQAFSTPAGLGVPSMMNEPAIRQLALPSFGGIGTAESLCRFYDAILEPGLLDAPTLRRIHQLIITGEDRVLRIPTAFTAGFMKDPVTEGRKVREIFGPSLIAFGHPGAGGSHAFADPENRIAFAYLMNQMEPGVFPNQKSLDLVKCLYANGA
jgi:CubicO group peptidase (beta-lactamase class C family)